MIKTEILGVTKHTYSDTGYKIQKIGTNEIYDDAVDIINSEYEYLEILEKIENINKIDK